MPRQNLVRRFLAVAVVIFLVAVPASVMAFLALRSLEEIKYKEDFYYEKVGHDVAMDVISTLEHPLVGAGRAIVEGDGRDYNLGCPEDISALLTDLESLDTFSSKFFWHPCSVYPESVQRLFFDEEYVSGDEALRLSQVFEKLSLDIFEECETYNELPRGFLPVQHLSSTVAISSLYLSAPEGGGVESDPWILELILTAKNEVMGLLFYKLNIKEYLRSARKIYNESSFFAVKNPRYEEILGELSIEVFFNLASFNDEAVESSKEGFAERDYVFRSERVDSIFWGVRVYKTVPGEGQITARVVNSMTAMLAGLFALILLGIFILYGFVSREVQLARLKSNFVSNVSHELKTPLSLIRLFAETLELGRITSDEEKQRFYSIINKESQRLTHLIDNILDFSRIEEGEKKYDITPSDLDDLIKQTLDAYRYQIESRGFELEVVIEPGLPKVPVDADSFRQAVLNLLDNAVKFSGDERRIKVGLSARPGFVTVSVNDRGIGISQADLPHIFEKFFRVSHKDIYLVKGSGLGLSVVKHIMDAHLGKIEVSSKLGKGSEFLLHFPVNSKAGAPAPEVSEEESLEGLGEEALDDEDSHH